MLRWLLPCTLYCLLLPATTFGKGVFQEPDAFVKEMFGDLVKPEVVWLDEKLRKQLEHILQHPYDGHRIRYWKQATKSLWILDEVGKTKPITIGIVIDNHRIDKMKVLIFRESRGWEVKHAFFTNQFNHAGLGKDDALDRHIDGISGATLSVRAVTKLARIALLLDRHVNP